MDDAAWQDWANRPGEVRIFLVELSARRLADGAAVPLYLSNYYAAFPGRQYLPCVQGLPELTRQANDTLTANHVPVWGELTLFITPEFCPDAGDAIAWNELLTPELYSLESQPLTILLGGAGFAYEDFRPVFSGWCFKHYQTDDNLLTLTLYDKSRDLETKVPDYELPESPRVDEGSWNQAVPAVLGKVKNYKPSLILNNIADYYTMKYALACHVIQALDDLYRDNVPQSTPHNYLLIQKDLFPAAKDGDGAAVMDPSGPYTGALNRAEWLVQIDSITRLNEIGQAGPSVGLATFRWSLDKGVTWLGEGILTWKLALDPTTIAHPVAVGWGALTLAGDYAGEVKYPYKLQISADGYVGRDAKFQFSPDNGVTWSAEIAIPNTDPIACDKGLTAAFTGVAGSLSATTKTPAAASPGTASFGGAYDASSYRRYWVEILTPGDVGTATFRWSDDDRATWHSDTGAPAHNPYITGLDVALSHGLTISFYGVTPEPDPPVDDFDSGDVWICHVPALVAGDSWTWGFKEIPIPLADGVAVQFLSKAEAVAQGIDARFLTAADDFALADEWRFILGSSVLLSVGDGGNITADAQGLISSVLGAYSDKIGELIRALPVEWCSWDGAADFDPDALTAFNASFPYQAGLLVDSPTTISAIIDKLLSGIPAFYTLRLNGKFLLRELAPPAGSPRLTLTDHEIFPDQTGSGPDQDLLYRRVYLHYDRNPNVQSNPASYTNQEQLDWLWREFRQVSARDESVRRTYPLAGDLGPLDTCLVNRAEAKALAQRLLSIYSVKRDKGVANCGVQPYVLDLGDELQLRRPKFGLDHGADYVLLGADQNFNDESSQLTIWR
ncbi:MAG: hypothetical protein NTY36_00875 [Deltaproteobacteria bacterium]|nr:hypothetical protein [Deltaproteobacteria bacterium]